MPRAGFETTISAFEQGKTLFAFDRAATVIDKYTIIIVELVVFYFEKASTVVYN
jgi:hypothetical protein